MKVNAKILAWLLREAFNISLNIVISPDDDVLWICLNLKKNVFEEGYHRSSKTPNLDKTKFLKIYCNLVDNKEDNEFLTNVFIKNNIGDQIIYENHNNYKRKKILDTTFNYIEFCVKNENNEDIVMKDFFSNISLYKLNIYERIRRFI